MQFQFSCTECLLQKKPYPNSSPLCHPEPPSGGAPPRSPSTLPRSHITAARAAAGRDGQLVSLEAQHSEVERKKDVFLDHLRQKYPHHAAIIMGHQGRKGEQQPGHDTSNQGRIQDFLNTEVQTC
ncbi:hypothetical protein NQZ68_020872 [Dissostichus eleginoides]|nr:hypothetical protein NQZ68_020872 [Dissostichus eleginoides]